jgi:hypothetical protein
MVPGMRLMLAIAISPRDTEEERADKNGRSALPNAFYLPCDRIGPQLCGPLGPAAQAGPTRAQRTGVFARPLSSGNRKRGAREAKVAFESNREVARAVWCTARRHSKRDRLWDRIATSPKNRRMPYNRPMVVIIGTSPHSGEVLAFGAHTEQMNNRYLLAVKIRHLTVA